MTSTLHAFAKALIASIAACLSRTSSASGTGVDLLDYEGSCCFVLDAGAATAGTNPTLDVTFEESLDDGATDAYAAVPAGAFQEGTNFGQVTNAASMQVRHFNVSDRKRYIRAKWVLGGTATPTFPFGVAFLGQKKYQ
jgi:hypothetical protein